MLISTKLQPPRLASDSVLRSHLTDRLTRGLDRKFTLISAQAGAGKSTLLAQWLQGCEHASAWLTLDSNDNDLRLFAGYLCAAIQTAFPDACGQFVDLLNASTLRTQIGDEYEIVDFQTYDEMGEGDSFFVVMRKTENR